MLRALLSPSLLSRIVSNSSLSPKPIATSNAFFTHAASTPLTQIALNVETVMENLRLKNHMAEDIELLTQTLLHIHHLQTLIKVTASGSETKRHRFPAKAALEELVIRCHQPQQGKHLKASLLIDQNAWLSGHSFYLQEVLSCIITNSFEAYGKYQRRKTIALVAMQHARKLHIYVCDQGHGMNWLTHQLATRQGFTKKPSGQGLGLAFVKQTIEQYFKGKFALASSAEVGTVAMIQIPLRA